MTLRSVLATCSIGRCAVLQVACILVRLCTTPLTNCEPARTPRAARHKAAQHHERQKCPTSAALQARCCACFIPVRCSAVGRMPKRMRAVDNCDTYQPLARCACSPLDAAVQRPLVVPKRLCAGRGTCVRKALQGAAAGCSAAGARVTLDPPRPVPMQADRPTPV